jgi:hypothetical protein
MGGAGTAPRTPRARDPLDGRLLCWQDGAMGSSAGIGALLGRMEGLLEPLEASGDPGRFFLATYLRTTRAVAEELDRGGFRDPAWVERWDVAFADLYLDAAYATRLAELERLAATRVADLTAPGQVVLKLAIKGFGVRLPDA